MEIMKPSLAQKNILITMCFFTYASYSLQNANKNTGIIYFNIVTLCWPKLDGACALLYIFNRYAVHFFSIDIVSIVTENVFWYTMTYIGHFFQLAILRLWPLCNVIKRDPCSYTTFLVIFILNYSYKLVREMYYSRLY